MSLSIADWISGLVGAVGLAVAATLVTYQLRQLMSRRSALHSRERRLVDFGEALEAILLRDPQRLQVITSTAASAA
ncbi:MAG: hypothetical protein IH957_12280, partial [Chloroflexi bacterium]|nr:hypothetical protein [Chloroflexota bacterium]